MTIHLDIGRLLGPVISVIQLSSFRFCSKSRFRRVMRSARSGKMRCASKIAI